ncbi:hypothetical protein EBT25_06130, partial [bacterium]|nr:hypothetical protein [bacterium]
ELASDWTYVGNSYGGSIVAATCDASSRRITFILSGATAGITGGGTLPTLAYNNSDGDNSIANADGALGAVAATTLTDTAYPTVLAAYAGRSVTSREILRYNFSEDIEFLEDLQFIHRISGFRYDHDSFSISISGSSVTLDLGITPLFGLYDISFEPTDLVGMASYFEDYLVVRTSSSAEESVSSRSSTVNVESPEEGDWVPANSQFEIIWSSESDGASYATLSYSVDGGGTWENIVRNTLNDGSYVWNTPALSADEVMVRVAATDLADELAVDTSGAFVLEYAVNEASDLTHDEETIDEIDGIIAGDYIIADGSSTIYYIDQDMSRRPFFDAQTYLTYEDDFDAVTEVSSNTLAKFSIGAPMMPKPGVVLVKIQSVAKVYMVEEAADGSYELRWITSEEVAEDMFGSQWSSYVLDVDATLFTRYEMGDDVTDADDESVDRDMMKMRMHLHE